MSRGRHRNNLKVDVESRKGALLSADERAEAARLRRCRFSPAEIARALGRRIPDVEAFLNSPEASHA